MSKRVKLSKVLAVIVLATLCSTIGYTAGEAKGLTRGCVFGIQTALSVFGAGTDIDKARDYCKREAK